MRRIAMLGSLRPRTLAPTVTAASQTRPCCRPIRANRSARRQQLLKRPLLDDTAGAQHHDLVHRSQRRKPMRNADDGAVFLQPIDGRLNLGFSARIERRRRFIENNDRCVADECARDRDALSLSAG